jgi:hypothetical protein
VSEALGDPAQRELLGMPSGNDEPMDIVVELSLLHKDPRARGSSTAVREAIWDLRHGWAPADARGDDVLPLQAEH